MGGLGTTVTGGVVQVSAVGVFLTVAMLVLATVLKRLEKGSDAAVAGLGGLNDKLRADIVRAEAARDVAIEALKAESEKRQSVQEYARSLESRLGIPYRSWSAILAERVSSGPGDGE